MRTSSLRPSDSRLDIMFKYTTWLEGRAVSIGPVANMHLYTGEPFGGT